MRKINANVKMVYMTVNEIQQKCKHDNANRCYVTNGEEAAMKGYAYADGKKAKIRIAKCRRAIAKGWSICCPMVVHNVKGELYITDGQGRFEAVVSENENRIAHGGEAKFTEIPVLIIERDSIEQMRDDIRAMNNNNTNWNVSDTLHCEAVAEGGEKKERYDIIRRYQDELNLTTDYIPRLILFGYHGHSRSEILNVKFSEHHEFMLDVFKRFYESQDTRTNAKLRNKCKRVEVAMVLNSVVTHIINACGHDNYNLFSEVVDGALTKLCNGISRLNDDEYMRLLGSRSAFIGTVFMDIISSRNRNKHIALAANNFRAAKLGQYSEVA